MDLLVEIKDSITVQEAVDFVESPSSGGVAVFIGTVRNQTKGKSVQKLYFECYTPMALSEMEKIARHIQQEMGIQRIAILHVSGEKLPGETVVVIAAAAPHR
ncbi:MAG TPA: molybdenum cofactor biosynthesis protein MoaE, partial [Chitinophaga sp.]